MTDRHPGTIGSGLSRPLLLGHRGAPEQVPENTIASFREAMRQGADGVELDVQRTLDGLAVVIHDDTLDRTTNGAGRVDRMRWQELAHVRAGGESIPSLREAVDWARDAGAVLNVEIKAASVEEATLEALTAGGMLERTIISSFDGGIVSRVGKLAPRARRFLLSEQFDAGTLAAVHDAGAEGVCLGVDAARASALEVLDAHGLPVIVWTVNEPARIRELLAAGVLGVITNRPAEAAAVAREMGLSHAGPSPGR